MNAKKSESVSTYQEYLPAILQEDVFVGRFLLAFEKILSGLQDSPSSERIITAESQNPPGLEEILDKIYLYFNPKETPEEFLPWLAGWVALSLRDDWKPEVKRAFIQQIVGLYRLRGTKAGLIEILKTYLKNAGFGEKVAVYDEFDNFPNYFQVQLVLNDPDPEKYWRQARIAKAIIDREKPAQTFYSLKILVPTMRITKRAQVAFPFKLFESIQEQRFAIKVKITPHQSNNISLDKLANQLVIQLQGKTREITIGSTEIVINYQFFTVNCQLNYRDFQDNLSGFYVKLSNRTDKDFIGQLAIQLCFEINEQEYSKTLLEQQLNLSPVLKICRLDSNQEISEGNTIFHIANPPARSGMRITEYLWTSPYNFQTFTAPTFQELQPEITAIIEKIELEAIVEITEPNPVTEDILNKIMVHLKDEVSDFHLFTPETSIDNNKIIIKRSIYYQYFLQTIDRLSVTIKSFNNIAITGKVTVLVNLEINQSASRYELLTENFILAAVPPQNILQICRNKIGTGGIDPGKIPTILGTTTQ